MAPIEFISCRNNAISVLKRFFIILFLLTFASYNAISESSWEQLFSENEIETDTLVERLITESERLKKTNPEKSYYLA